MEEKTAERGKAFTWHNVRQVLTSRMLLGVYLGQYGINALTYFFVTWFPIYLVKERGLTILEAGFAAAAPALPSNFECPADDGTKKFPVRRGQ